MLQRSQPWAQPWLIACWAGLLLVPACSKKDTDDDRRQETAAAGASAATAATATTTSQVAADVPCPDDDALRSRLTSVWKPTDGWEIGAVACEPGRFPAAGHVIHARLFRGERGFPADAEERVAILAADGTLVAAAEPMALAAGEAAGGFDLSIEEIADLDGDGADEVIVREVIDYREVRSETLRVLAIQGDRLDTVFSLVTSKEVSDFADEDQPLVAECTATFELTEPDDAGKRLMQVSASATGTSKDDLEDCLRGEHTVTFADGKATARAARGRTD